MIDNPLSRSMPGAAGWRDYIAAKVLPALIAIGPTLGSINPDELAADAYRFADAMLKVRALAPATPGQD